MDNQLRLATGDDQTLADAAETINRCELEIATLIHRAVTHQETTPDERRRRIRELDQERGAAEAILAPHVPPGRDILVWNETAEWILYRHPQTGRISSTPHRPDPEPDDLADLEDVGGWNP